MSLNPEILSGKKPLDLLALQGGGSFCAFSAGAIYYLLTRTNIQFKAISGVSGGAINAVLLLNALPDRKAAANALKKFWLNDVAVTQAEQMVQQAFMSLVSFLPLPKSIKRLPLNANPIYSIMKGLDFDKIRSSKTGLYIAVTEENQRKSHVIEKKKITPEWVMASASLSHYFLPVEIEGRSYVDGAEYHPDYIKRAGFNPPIFTALKSKKEFTFLSMRLNQDREEIQDKHHSFECYVQQPYERDIVKLKKHKNNGKNILGYELRMPDGFHPKRKMDTDERLIRDLFIMGIREMRYMVSANDVPVIV